jgi:hypothetical protein
MTNSTCLSRPKHRCSCLPSARSRLQVYANTKFQSTTPRSEDSIKLREGRSKLQASKSYPRSHDSSGPRIATKEPSNSCRNILGPLDSLNPINLKGVSTRFLSRYFRQHQLFGHQLQQVRTIYIFNKRKPSTQLKVSPRS